MNTELPPAQLRITLARAGELWDAVRVSTAVGMQVMAKLGEACGSVVSDDRSMWFFVQPGEGRGMVMPGVTAYLGGAHVLIPADDVTAPPGPHWARTAAQRCTPAAHLLLAVKESAR